MPTRKEWLWVVAIALIWVTWSSVITPALRRHDPQPTMRDLGNGLLLFEQRGTTDSNDLAGAVAGWKATNQDMDILWVAPLDHYEETTVSLLVQFKRKSRTP